MLTSLSEEQRLVQDSAEQWLAANCPFQPGQPGTSSSQRRSIWSSLAELGWLGLPVDEEHGGSGLGVFEAGLLSEAFGRYLVTTSYAFGVVAVNQLLQNFGSDEQRRRWLPAVADGSMKMVLAHAEPKELSTWGERTTKLVLSEGGWCLVGKKVAVDAPSQVDAWFVSATDEQGESVVIYCPSNHRGLTAMSYPTVDGGLACDIHFDLLPVSEEYVLRAHDCQHALLNVAVARGLVALCWQAAGSIDALVKQTTLYTSQRKQFGKHLSEFQVVQHRLAEMKVQSIEALACCQLTSLRLDRGGEDGQVLAQLAVQKISKAADFVAKQSIQLHGAMGVCEELPIAASFRLLQAFKARAGAYSQASSVAAAALLESNRFRFSSVLGA